MSKLILSILLLSGCATQTPEYSISISGTSDLHDVDTAWSIAASLVNKSPHKLIKDQWVTLAVQPDPIRISGSEQMYHGISYETSNTVQQIGGCLLDINTPTVHEFLHTIFYITTGDSDPEHTNSQWHYANEEYGPCHE
jgi:hypothetical protein